MSVPEDTTVINLSPVFVTSNERRLGLNSIFLLICLVFLLTTVLCVLWGFFKVEIYFLYYSIFKKIEPSREDKEKYNNYMAAIRTAIMTDVRCITSNGIWLPVYDDDQKVLKPVKGDGIVFFPTEKECKSFLGIKSD